jgi:hypothetical protein
VWGEGEGKWWAEMERNRLIRGGMIIWTAWAAVNWFLGARVVCNGIYHRRHCTVKWKLTNPLA